MENLADFNFDGIEKLLDMGLEVDIFYKMNSVVVSANEVSKMTKLIACNDDENILYALCGLSYKIKEEDVCDVELDNILLDDILADYSIKFKKNDGGIVNAIIYTEKEKLPCILKNINGNTFKDCLNNLNNSLKKEEIKSKRLSL